LDAARSSTTWSMWVTTAISANVVGDCRRRRGSVAVSVIEDDAVIGGQVGFGDSHASAERRCDSDRKPGSARARSCGRASGGAYPCSRSDEYKRMNAHMNRLPADARGSHAITGRDRAVKREVKPRIEFYDHLGGARGGARLPSLWATSRKALTHGPVCFRVEKLESLSYKIFAWSACFGSAPSRSLFRADEIHESVMRHRYQTGRVWCQLSAPL
jgi:hypothetical protein